MAIKIKLLDGGKLPVYKTDGAACADCYARLPTESVTILAGKRTYIPLGFCIELPKEIEAVIRPRSGLSGDEIDVIQGTIDFDFRGEVKALVVNNKEEDFVIHNLDRICQMKIQEAKQYKFEIVSELSETERGTKGLGSTGVK